MTSRSNDCVCANDPGACSCTKETDAEVLARIAKTFGTVHPPFQVLAQRPGALSAFFAYRDEILEQGPLSVRDRALVQLTTAVALRLSFCIEKLVKGAKAAGVSQEEIVQAALVASLQSANSMLHSAHEGILAG